MIFPIRNLPFFHHGLLRHQKISVARFDDVASSSFFPNSVEMVEMVKRVVQSSAIGVVDTDVMIE